MMMGLAVDHGEEKIIMIAATHVVTRCSRCHKAFLSVIAVTDIVIY